MQSLSFSFCYVFYLFKYFFLQLSFRQKNKVWFTHPCFLKQSKSIILLIEIFLFSIISTTFNKPGKRKTDIISSERDIQMKTTYLRQVWSKVVRFYRHLVLSDFNSLRSSFSLFFFLIFVVNSLVQKVYSSWLSTHKTCKRTTETYLSFLPKQTHL